MIRSKLIRDPIHNYIEIYHEEIPIVDHPLVQRLRHIRQLQTTYLTYVGGEHSRFQHSLGVMHLATEFSSHLGNDKDMIRTTRLLGLLHDIGHGPYSHTFDDAIIQKSSELKQKGIRSHEDLGLMLIKNSEIRDYLEDLGVYDMFMRIAHNNIEEIPRDLRPYHYVVKNWIYPADIMDFLMRDAYYTGTKEYGFVDYYRLIKFSEIVDGEIAIAEQAISTLRNFLMARSYMFSSVYFHPTCRATDFIVVDMLFEANKYYDFEGIILKAIQGDYEDFLMLTDESVVYLILRDGKNTRDKHLKKAYEYASMLVRRIIPWKMIYFIDIPFRGEDAAVSYKYFDVRKHIEEVKAEVMPKLEDLGVSEEDLVFDHTKYKYLPDNPREVKGTIAVKTRNGELHEVPIVKIAEGYPLYTITIRVYVSKKHREHFDTIKRTLKEAFEKLKSTSIGVTM
ncbi:MAG: HD domain-containing protein [Euryarchaeota archaeon]|nr:HD domain-containing protein [Euryarchaeota archaeon]